MLTTPHSARAAGFIRRNRQITREGDAAPAPALNTGGMQSSRASAWRRGAAWFDGRGPLVAAIVIAVVTLPMTMAVMVQLVELAPGAFVTGWIVALACLLHAVTLVCHRWPLIAFAAGSIVMLGLALTMLPGFSSAILIPSSAAYLLLMWQAALTQPRPLALGALGTGIAGAGVITVAGLVWNPSRDPFLLALEFASFAGIVAAAWAFGQLARVRRDAATEREEERVRSAVADERTRISRDLHDVVSHSLTVMIAQAEAARVLSDDPRAAASLDRVAETGREAMTGLRGMLTVLEDDTAGTELAPPADIGRLGTLVASVVTSDRHASFTERGTPRSLAPDAELALYRSVQEALTNVTRHLRPPMRVRVELDWRPDEVVATVSDDGGDGPTAGSEGARTGLIGMRERVRRAGGSLRIDRGDGWTVRVSVPAGAAA